VIAIARLDFRRRNCAIPQTGSPGDPTGPRFSAHHAHARDFTFADTHSRAPPHSGPISRLARHEGRTKETRATAARMCRMHAHARAHARRDWRDQPCRTRGARELCGDTCTRAEARKEPSSRLGSDRNALRTIAPCRRHNRPRTSATCRATSPGLAARARHLIHRYTHAHTQGGGEAATRPALTFYRGAGTSLPQ